MNELYRITVSHSEKNVTHCCGRSCCMFVESLENAVFMYYHLFTETRLLLPSTGSAIRRWMQTWQQRMSSLWPRVVLSRLLPRHGVTLAAGPVSSEWLSRDIAADGRVNLHLPRSQAYYINIAFTASWHIRSVLTVLELASFYMMIRHSIGYLFIYSLKIILHVFCFIVICIVWLLPVRFSAASRAFYVWRT